MYKSLVVVKFNGFLTVRTTQKINITRLVKFNKSNKNKIYFFANVKLAIILELK